MDHPSSTVDYHDVNRLVQNYESRCNDGRAVVPKSPYYPSSIMISETSTERHRRRRETRSSTSTSSSGVTRPPTVFDTATDGGLSEFSTSSSPPPLVGEAVPRRPPLGLPFWNRLIANHDAHLPLPCEFVGYADCSERFHIDEVGRLIHHVAYVHLGGNFPASVTSCWFCDEVNSQPATDQASDRRECYQTRMEHIVQHFREGMTTRDIRPDFHFVNHLRVNNLISDHQFQVVIQWSEVRVALGRPPRADNEPSDAEELVVEKASRRRSNRSRRFSERY